MSYKDSFCFFVIFFKISFSEIQRFLGFISAKTGVNPLFMTETISEIQVNVGTIISPPDPLSSFNASTVRKFAEDPEFTKTLYFTPSHLDHFLSNSFTFI